MCCIFIEINKTFYSHEENVVYNYRETNSNAMDLVQLDKEITGLAQKSTGLCVDNKLFSYMMKL